MHAHFTVDTACCVLRAARNSAHNHHRRPGMLAQDGSRAAHYTDAQAINSAVMALAPTLMQLRSTNTTIVDGNNPAAANNCTGKGLNCTAWPALEELTEDGCPVVNVTGGSFVVGCFEHEQDARIKGVMIMNYEVLYVPRSTWAAPRGHHRGRVCSKGRSTGVAVLFLIMLTCAQY